MSSDKVFLYQNQMSENDLLSYHHNLMSETPLHWHNFIEIELVLGGTAEHIHNGIVSTLKRGHVSLFRINDYHAVKNVQELDVLCLSIKDNAISEKTLAMLNSTQNNLAFDLDDETFNTVHFFCEACVKENSLHNRNEDYIKNILDCILILLLRFNNAEALPVKKHHNSQINNAINYLHSHFRENPSLNDVAKISHYSSTHFSHVFRKKIGCPFNDYLNELKISYAKQLLNTTNLKIIDIGYQSGFNSYNNFYSTFKQHTNLSPAEYKKKKMTNVHFLGYSWRFAIIDTDINTNPAYVYIKTCVLMHDNEYYFSYYYSYDYAIAVDSIECLQNGEKIAPYNVKITDLKDKRRTHKVEFFFKTDIKGEYRVILKMGKGLNNIGCDFRYTTLSNLTLYEMNNKENKNNLAQDYTHASGRVTWSSNSDAYNVYIDR